MTLDAIKKLADCDWAGMSPLEVALCQNAYQTSDSTRYACKAFDGVMSHRRSAPRKDVPKNPSVYNMLISTILQAAAAWGSDHASASAGTLWEIPAYS